MSLIVTSYDLNAEGGCENCRCSRLQEPTNKHKRAQRSRRLNTVPSLLRIESRHPVLFENSINLGGPLFHHLFNLVLQVRVFAAHTHRNVEYKRHERLIDLR